ncbi:MAG: RsiV family protein [Henriciella sp.]
MKHLLHVILVLGLLVGCQSFTDQGPPQAVTEETETLFASASFPSGLWKLAPELDSQLREDAQVEFKQMQASASYDYSEDPDYFRAYGIVINWTLLGHSGDLISLAGLHSYDAGGAHPNYQLSGLIYDNATQTPVQVLDLFQDKDQAQARLLKAIRSDILRQKTERYRDNEVATDGLAEEVEGLITDSGEALAAAALAPSKKEDQFGGLYVYFSPYELGAYAEGAYTASIPQTAFRDLLKPQFVDLFSGEPILKTD